MKTEAYELLFKSISGVIYFMLLNLTKIPYLSRIEVNFFNFFSFLLTKTNVQELVKINFQKP